MLTTVRLMGLQFIYTVTWGKQDFQSLKAKVGLVVFLVCYNLLFN